MLIILASFRRPFVLSYHRNNKLGLSYFTWFLQSWSKKG